ncbi:Transthyretin-like family protein [Dictyocaulus viviparus]|uniref:Transthyretin-like family protein n=1 Tax=Dictyocaulus viviparus TaxID=29172 RepID=A0A0D8XM69_DICVI|nr:Transthyretin-like family protein [Dictyocaulus viviparus]
MLKLIIFCLLSHTVFSLGIGRTQSSGVKGRLICDGKPAVGVTVKLYDDDREVGLIAVQKLSDGLELQLLQPNRLTSTDENKQYHNKT